MHRLIIIFLLFGFILACKNKEATTSENKDKGLFPMDTTAIKTYGMGKKKLSMYGFFQGKLGDLNPIEGVLPYELNSPLFSDYAEKARFNSLPFGSSFNYIEKEVFDFPQGTTLIKNFHYPTGDGGRRIVETRLLINEPFGWRPITYIWNEDQTEAYFHMLGAEIPVVATDYEGATHKINYGVPDINQCKNCHMKDNGTKPIGPTARQLNRDVVIDGDTVNQLEYYSPFIAALPNVSAMDAVVDYMDDDHPIDVRARSYLDSNCGNCHRPEGSAKTSGLNLNFYESDLYKIGINKAPVAAGKASGDRLYDIVPGNPDGSILLYRMESTDPEIMMPEMGRTLIHKEGIQLIRSWIESL